MSLTSASLVIEEQPALAHTEDSLCDGCLSLAGFQLSLCVFIFSPFIKYGLV
jgi:hypothetical protein